MDEGVRTTKYSYYY